MVEVGFINHHTLYTDMKVRIPLLNSIRQKVWFLYNKLKLAAQETIKGRKLAIPIAEIISLALFKQQNGIPTKKALHKICAPDCSYKTLVVNMNRFARLAAIMLTLIMRINRALGHLIKHTDSTDIPVSSNKNARYHRVMAGLADWGHTGKGWFFGLKLHITTDLNRRILAIRFTSGNVHDKTVFIRLNKGLYGIFVADAAYLSRELQREFYQENQRILFTASRKNMRLLMIDWQDWLLKTRMTIEINFRNLKLFYGLITSLPRSVNGYLANYIYSLLAYIIAL
jgi:hypothetical protein